MGLRTAFAFADTTANPSTSSPTNTSITSGDKRSAQFVNLTNTQKATLAQAHTLMQAGKKDEAKTLLNNAGIKMPERKEGKGNKGMDMHSDMKKLNDLIVAGNYSAFKTAAVNSPLANIDEATFNSLLAPAQTIKNAQVQEQTARTQMQTILKNAGVQMPQKNNFKTFINTTQAQ